MTALRIETLGHSCCGDRVAALELHRRKPRELSVTSDWVLPDLDVVAHRVGQIDAGSNALVAVESQGESE